jgi:dihydropteroate synthase
MQRDPRYDDVVGEVVGFLVDKAGEAFAGGVAEVWVDPGIGFGKSLDHNLLLLRHLDRLVETGIPVLVGTSRKSFLGVLASSRGGPPLGADDRLEGSLATAVWAMRCGAAVSRAPDVAATVQAAMLVGDGLFAETASARTAGAAQA